MSESIQNAPSGAEGAREITPQEITELLKKAKMTERKYILELESYHRQGDAFADDKDFEVIYGEAKIVETECWDEGYPYRKGCNYLVIPETVPVVVREWWYSDAGSTDEGERMYIFTKDGWKKVDVK